MPTFAICRTKKIKTWATLARSAGHNCRTNADERPHLVKKLAGQPAWASAEIEVLTGEVGWQKDWQTEVEAMHLRKLAQGQSHTLAREFFLGASPEFFEGKSRAEVDAWAKANLEWLAERFGAERVKFACLHLDEQTPHIAAYVVGRKADPKNRGNGWTLSDNALGLGGSKAALVELQTEYGVAMERFALTRGRRGSKATHQTVAQWRKKMAEPLPAITVPKPPEATMGDRIDIEAYGKRVAREAAAEVYKQFKPVRQRAQEVPQLRKQLDKLLSEMERFRPLMEAYKKREDFFAKALGMLIGFEPDLNTQQGMTKTVKAVKALRHELRGDSPPTPPQPPAPVLPSASERQGARAARAVKPGPSPRIGR